jgi:hypothetical protein
VICVFITASTELLIFHSLRMNPFIFGCGIISLFTFCAF